MSQRYFVLKVFSYLMVILLFVLTLFSGVVGESF